MTGRTTFLACASLAAALSACASAGGSYPSLALREAERIHGRAEPAAADRPEPLPVEAGPSPDLAGRLSGLVERANAAHRRFESLRPGARTRSDGDRGSDAASLGSIALGQLTAARGQTSAVLGEIDSLDIDDRAGLTQGESANSPAIAAARDQVAGLLREEDRVLAQFGG